MRDGYLGGFALAKFRLSSDNTSPDLMSACFVWSFMSEITSKPPKARNEVPSYILHNCSGLPGSLIRMFVLFAIYFTYFFFIVLCDEIDCIAFPPCPGYVVTWEC
ncbi:hypothetical protein ACN38_g11119 [Penicillium nordicum]|uniref:Uncharacterized protein n=1 Tax=Penicillium nordicum TaxID=229535 RepID=A0A0M8NZB0_9EURO|nr:hypothetical protein ACN38_g11119 [Penicillium nordicum]